MGFNQASQNGIVPQDSLFTRASPHTLFVNTTTLYYSQPVYIRLVNTAPYPKSVPATFYSNVTNNGTTSTITLGDAYFEGPTATLKTFELGTGTNEIFASWPGESRYEGFTATLVSSLAVNPGATLIETSTLHTYPASGVAVTGEDNITLTLIVTSAQQLPGNILWYDGTMEIGQTSIVNNQTTFITNQIGAGARILKAVWPGGFIGGTFYQGFSKTITYTVLAGSNSQATLILSISPDHGVYAEGDINYIATLNTSTSMAGSVKFYNSATNQLVGSASVANNQAVLSLSNTLAVGTYTFYSVWDGNSTAHPRYLPLTSSSTSWTELARETISDLAFSITPTLTYYTEPIVFAADITAPSQVVGNIDFYDNGYILATAPIISNHAEVSILTLTTGTHEFYAYYVGSTVAPKYYGKKSNVINTTTLAGEPLPFSLAIQSSFGENQFYYNEPLKIVLSSNTSTVVAGTTATFTLDNPVITGSVFIASTTGTTSTVRTTTDISGIVPGTQIYSDPMFNNLLGTVNNVTMTSYSIYGFDPTGSLTYGIYGISPYDSTGPIVTVKTPYNANLINKKITIPSYTSTIFTVYRRLNNGQFDTTTTSAYNLTPAMPAGLPGYILSNSTLTFYQATASIIVLNTIQTGLIMNLDTPVALSNTPIWIKDPQYAQLGSAVFVGSTATTSTIVNTTTSVIAYSDWIGSQINNGHYYMEEIQYSNTVTLGKRYLTEPIILSALPNPDVLGDPINITLNSTATIALSGTTATIYANGTYLTDGIFTGTNLSIAPIINQSGTVVISASWHGGSTIEGRFFQPKNSTTASIFVAERGTYPGTITLSSLSNPLYQLNKGTAVIQASVTTATNGTLNLVEINGTMTNIIGTGTFNGTVTNIILNPNSFSNTSTNTHVIRAEWLGQPRSPGYYPYFGTSTNTLTQTVNLATLTVTTTAITSYPKTMIATANASSADIGTVTFKALRTQYGFTTTNTSTYVSVNSIIRSTSSYGISPTVGEFFIYNTSTVVRTNVNGTNKWIDGVDYGKTAYNAYQSYNNWPGIPQSVTQSGGPYKWWIKVSNGSNINTGTNVLINARIKVSHTNTLGTNPQEYWPYWSEGNYFAERTELYLTGQAYGVYQKITYNNEIYLLVSTVRFTGAGQLASTKRCYPPYNGAYPYWYGGRGGEDDLLSIYTYANSLTGTVGSLEVISSASASYNYYENQITQTLGTVTSSINSASIVVNAGTVGTLTNYSEYIAPGIINTTSYAVQAIWNNTNPIVQGTTGPFNI
jgi:hypothetical protein